MTSMPLRSQNSYTRLGPKTLTFPPGRCALAPSALSSSDSPLPTASAAGWYTCKPHKPECVTHARCYAPTRARAAHVAACRAACARAVPCIWAVGAECVHAAAHRQS
jgi:hypothetical protein